MSWKRLKDIFPRRLEHVFKTSWRRLEDVLKTFLQDVLKPYWRRLCKTPWRSLENVLKTSWKCLEDVLARRLENVLKTSSEDVWLRRIYWSWPRRLEDVFWRRRRKTSSWRLQDGFIETNVCWVHLFIFLIDCRNINWKNTGVNLKQIN